MTSEFICGVKDNITDRILFIIRVCQQSHRWTCICTVCGCGPIDNIGYYFRGALTFVILVLFTDLRFCDQSHYVTIHITLTTNPSTQLMVQSCSCEDRQSFLITVFYIHLFLHCAKRYRGAQSRYTVSISVQQLKKWSLTDSTSLKQPHLLESGVLW